MTSRIPDQCATCPWLKIEEKHLNGHELEQDKIIRTATSEDLDSIAEFFSSQLQQVPQEIIDAYGELPDGKAIASMIRTMGSKALEDVSHHIEKIEHDIEMMTAWCHGPIQLSETRNGVVYSVGLCGSQVLLDEEPSTPEPTNVRRYEIID